MAISFIAAAAVADANSVTLPSHQEGDVIVLAVYRHNSALAATFVSGWLPIVATGTASNWIGLFAKFAASASEVSGTWTNATDLAAAVYRSSNLLSFGRGTASNFVTSTVPYNSPGAGNGLSAWYVGCAGIRAIDTDLEVAPDTMTNRATAVGASAGEIALHDSNGASDGWTADSYVLTTGASFAGKAGVVEILDSGIAIPSGGAPEIRNHSRLRLAL